MVKINVLNIRAFLDLPGKNILNVHIIIGRLRLEERHCLNAITEDVSLEYLIPTTSGAGALTTALVDYLIQTHNDFIHFCCGKEKTQRYAST